MSFHRFGVCHGSIGDELFVDASFYDENDKGRVLSLSARFKYRVLKKKNNGQLWMCLYS